MGKVEIVIHCYLTVDILTKVTHVLNCAKFPWTYNGKSENMPLLLSHCRYFDKSFTEMFLRVVFTKHIIFVQSSEFDWLP